MRLSIGTWNVASLTAISGELTQKLDWTINEAFLLETHWMGNMSEDIVMSYKFDMYTKCQGGNRVSILEFQNGVMEFREQ